MKANFCEALLAAVFLDGGWEALLTAVERLLGATLTDPAHGVQDTRMQLQTWCLEHHRTLPVYTSERSGGSDHAPEFSASVTCGERTATGSGPSRKRAETAAAEALLRLLAT